MEVSKPESESGQEQVPELFTLDSNSNGNRYKNQTDHCTCTIGVRPGITLSVSLICLRFLAHCATQAARIETALDESS